MKKVLSFLFILISTFCLFGCEDTGGGETPGGDNPGEQEHDHIYLDALGYDEQYHWKMTECHPEEKIGMEEHVFDDGTVVREATDTEPGLIQYKCEVCFYIKEVDITVEHHHKFDENWSYDEYYHWHQALCEHSDMKQGFDSHTFGDPVLIQDPTETQIGITHYYCSECGYCNEVTTPKLEHIHEVSNTYSFNVDTHSLLCDLCNEELETGNHEFTEYIEIYPQEGIDGWATYTCICGYSEGRVIPALPIIPHEHNYCIENYDTENHWLECECGDKDGVTPHNLGSHVESEPTCGQPGQKFIACSDCWYNTYELIEPTGEHLNLEVYYAWSDGLESACKKEYCPDCYTLTVSDFYPSTKTSVVGVYCDEESYDLYTVVFPDGSTATQKHVLKYSTYHSCDYYAGQAPTCLEGGYEAYEVCRNCPYTTYQELEALDHNLITLDAKAATCYEEGHSEYTYCSRCDYESEHEVYNMLNHIINGSYLGDLPVVGEIYKFTNTSGQWILPTDERSDGTHHIVYNPFNYVEIEFLASATITFDYQYNYSSSNSYDYYRFIIVRTSKGETVDNPSYCDGGLHNAIYNDTTEFVKYESVTMSFEAGEKITLYIYNYNVNSKGFDDATHYRVKMNVDTYGELPAENFKYVEYIDEYETYLVDLCDENIECLECQEVLKYSVGHDWRVQFPVNSTCYTNGIDNHSKCFRCEEEEYRVLDTIDHLYDDNGDCVFCGLHTPTEGVVYTLNEDGLSYSVTGIELTGHLDVLYLDNHYNGKPVIGVDFNAFNDITVNKVVIPYSYEYCNYTSIYYTRAEELVIPAHLTNLAAIPTVTKVTIYNSEYLNENAISDLDNIETLVIKNVQNVKANAINNCTNLTTVVLEDIETIEQNAIFSCGVEYLETESHLVAGISNTDLVELKLTSSRILTGELDNLRNVDTIIFTEIVNYVERDVFKELVSVNKLVYLGDLLSWIRMNFENEYSNPTWLSGKLYINDELVTSFDDTDSNITNYSIYPYVFYNLKDFVSVNLTSMNGFSSYSFANSGLKTIYISAPSFWNFDVTAFMGTNVTDITFDVEDSIFEVVNGNVYRYNELILATNNDIKDGTEYIDEYAYMLCSSITELNIPYSVGRIAEGALSYLTNLEELTVPFAGLSYYSTGDEGLFGQIFSKTEKEGLIETVQNGSVFYIPVTLETVHVVTDGVTYYISAYAFQNCINLKTITISESIQIIYNNAFEGCSSLTSFTSPKSLAQLHDQAFKDCIGLVDVDLEECGSIYSGVFTGCKSLTTIRIPFTGKYNNVSNKEEGLFGYIFGEEQYNGSFSVTQNYSDTDSVTFYIPNSLENVIVCGTAINNYGFNNCSFLTDVSLEDSVEKIGDYAFAGCSGLTDFDFPSNLKFIGKGSFKDLNRIPFNVLPESLLTIGDYAFSGCTNAVNLKLPSNLGTLGECALENINIKEVVIPDTVQSIGYGALSGNHNIVSLTLPFIGEYRQTDYTLYDFDHHLGYIFGDGHIGTFPNIIGARVPDSLKIVNVTDCSALSYAFYDCDYIEVITLPERLEYVGAYAFKDCAALTEIELPASLKYIVGGAFANCTSLVGVEFNSVISSISEETFKGCTSLETVVIQDGLYEIGRYAFSGCINLKNISFSSSLSILGNEAFLDCSSLESAMLPDSLSDMGERVFYGCSSLSEINIPKGISRLYKETFAGTNITEVVIPDNIQYIHTKVFENCASLETVEFGRYVYEIDSYAFAGCVSLKEIYLPNNLSYLGTNVFKGCYGITKLSVVFVGQSFNYDQAYAQTCLGTLFGSEEYENSYPAEQSYGANSIVHYIPNGLIELDVRSGQLYRGSLQNITSLQKVTLSSDVKVIGDRVFKGCTNLSDLVIKGDVTTLGEDVFTDCSSLTTIKIVSGKSYLIEYYISNNHPEINITYINE